MRSGKKRQLNYELLRILAMLMIVCLHYLSKGGLLGDPARADMTATGYTAWFVEALCLVAVNVYVLISGYFGVDLLGSQTVGKRLTFWEVMRKPLKIWKQVFFYSMLFGCGAIVLGLQAFDPYRFFSYCFPIVTEHYWFATSYIFLCLMMPFLNAGISCLDQKELRWLLLGFLLLFSMAKTVIPMQLPWDKYGYDSLWFVVLYLTGAYIRRYEMPFLARRWRAAALYLGSTAAIFASFFLIRLVYLKTGMLGERIQYGYTYNFLFCYTGAVGLFLLFQPSKSAKSSSQQFLERFRKPVELFSGAAFGVYLIHEHLNLRGFWQRWLHCEVQAENSVAGFLGHMLVTVLCVYLVCTAMELVRQRGMLTWVPMILLLLYPLRHAAVGVDLMDAGYALGNYRFLDTVNEMWTLATYLANVAGVLLSKLPFGDCWIGMNVYCGLLIGVVAASVYYALWKRYGQRRRKFAVLLFGAEFTALSLCWAPPVILYHYLGYLLMTIAVMVLYAAIIRNKKSYFIIAGVILGCCVAVRMPNVTYMALILPVWCDCFWSRGRTLDALSWFQRLLRRTLYCIGGYLTGLLVPLGVICARYGLAAYPRMVTSLFGMTDHATDYKPASMITAMFGDYLRYSGWLLLFVFYMVCGLLMFWIAKKLERNHTLSKKIAFVLEMFYSFGFLVVLRFCYGRGMFGFDYTDNFSMYKWVTVYLLIAIGLCVWCLADQKCSREYKLWTVFLLVIIFITPLGSNNGLYPIMNNLFLVLPVSMLMTAEAFRKSRRARGKADAFGIVFALVLACAMIQSVLYGVHFVFHDAGAHQTAGQDNTRLELQCSSAGTGLAATRDKKTALEELDAYVYQNGLYKKRVILYGDIPAVSYLFDMEPAISTTWADLDSYGIYVLEEELARLAEESLSEEAPVIIYGRAAVERLTENAEGAKYEKWSSILSFAQAQGYQQCFENEEYVILSKPHVY